MELKKNENRKVSKFRTLFLNVGLVVTLIFTITAFEWKWEEVRIVIADPGIEDDDIIHTIPTTVESPKIPEPPKPKTKKTIVPKIIIKPDDFIEHKKEKVEVKPKEEDLDKLVASATIDDPIDHNVYIDLQVEKQALPELGFKKWYKEIGAYCGANLNERDRFRKGVVRVGFVIEKDGSLSNIEIIKSVHKRIDAIAIQSVKNAGRWSPAKISARPVRQRMIVPINFR